MQSKSNESRQPRGSVGLETVNGKLRIRLPRYLYEGKQRYISLGLEDTLENNVKANEVISDIQYDIRKDQFDFSRKKYKPQHLKLVINQIAQNREPSIIQLWEQYVKDQSIKKQWSESYKANMIGATTSHLNKINDIGNLHISDAETVYKRLESLNLSLDATKRVLVGLSAMVNWAKRNRITKEENLFAVFKNEIKPKPKDDTGDIDPFTAEERDAILNAIREDKFSRYKGKHKQYYPYLYFMFYTGCRTSEALGLKWEQIHLDKGYILFSEASVLAGTRKQIQKKGLKTQSHRRFPINSQLFLQLMLIPRRSEYVFVKEDCSPIKPNTFRQSVWKRVLDKLEIRYRKPYQTRHTFITLCLDRGVDVKDVAKWVGNSPEVIYKHYAGVKRYLQVPEL